MKSPLKSLVACCAACAALAAGPAAAQAEKAPAPAPAKETQAKAPGSQQNKMKTCNAEASRKALRGDERRAFMSACLKA